MDGFEAVVGLGVQLPAEEGCARQVEERRGQQAQVVARRGEQVPVVVPHGEQVPAGVLHGEQAPVEGRRVLLQGRWTRPRHWRGSDWPFRARSS